MTSGSGQRRHPPDVDIMNKELWTVNTGWSYRVRRKAKNLSA
jgi:hypothetical protein